MNTLLNRTFCFLCIVLLVLSLNVSLVAQGYIDLTKLTPNSTPLALEGIWGTGSNIGALAKVTNLSAQIQVLQHNHRYGIRFAGGVQGLGKSHFVNQADFLILDFQMQKFSNGWNEINLNKLNSVQTEIRPWFIKATHEYQIQANSSVTIPLYVLCVNAYDPPPDTVHNTTEFYELPDDVIRIYGGIERLNYILNDQLRPFFLAKDEANFGWYDGPNTADINLVSFSFLDIDPTSYGKKEPGYYSLDSLYLHPSAAQWAVWTISDNMGPVEMRAYLDTLRNHNGYPPIDDATNSAYRYMVWCCLRAAHFDDKAQLFWQEGFENPTSVQRNKSAIAPRDHILVSNYPNPFNSSTNVRIQTNRGQVIKVTIFDMQGKPIKTLFEGRLLTDELEVPWDGTTEKNRAASGIYFVKIKSYSEQEVLKIILIQ